MSAAMHTPAHVTPEYPRAYEAACKVDPFILASALDHIARTASKSRSQTRRIRWIEQRALIALSGQEYRDCDLDLPKDSGPNSAEKLERRMAYHIAVKHELAEQARRLCDRLAKESGMANEVAAMRAAIAKATGEAA